MSKFKKGVPRAEGAGRKAGTPNKINSEFKEAISEFVDFNSPKLQIWLDKIAEDNPAKAFDLLIKMMEFVIPKLSRTEYKGPETKENTTITINFVKPNPQEIEKSV